MRGSRHANTDRRRRKPNLGKTEIQIRSVGDPTLSHARISTEILM